jgi:hypothetical protein
VSLDYSNLPPELQAYIDAKVKEANTPPAPKELTAEEKVTAALALVKSELGSDHSVYKLHEALSEAVHALKYYIDAHTHGAGENS